MPDLAKKNETNLTDPTMLSTKIQTSAIDDKAVLFRAFNNTDLGPARNNWEPLSDFLGNGYVEPPGQHLEIFDDHTLFVIELLNDDKIYHGLWTVTHYRDLLRSGVADNIDFRNKAAERSGQQRRSVKGDLSPLLIAYNKNNEALEDLMQALKHDTEPILTNLSGKLHRVWKTRDAQVTGKMRSLLRDLGSVGLISGEDQLAGVLSQFSGCQNPGVSATDPGPELVSTFYIGAEQLQPQDHYLRYRPEHSFDPIELLYQLGRHFHIRTVGRNKIHVPQTASAIGMGLDGFWYELSQKAFNTGYTDYASHMAVSILFQKILQPAFFPKEGNKPGQFQWLSGDAADSALSQALKEEPKSIGFTFAPITGQQLMSVVYTKGALPADSFAFKVPIGPGMLIYNY